MSRIKYDKSEDSFAVKFGARLKAALKKKRLSQAWLADSLGVKEPRVSEWVCGNVVPGSDTLARIVLAVGCDPTWLLLGDDAREPLGTRESIYPDQPPGVTPEAWMELRELLPRLSDIYEAQEISQHAERWGWIRGNMLTFGDLVRADVEAHRIQKRKIRRAG